MVSKNFRIVKMKTLPIEIVKEFSTYKEAMDHLKTLSYEYCIESKFNGRWHKLI